MATIREESTDMERYGLLRAPRSRQRLPRQLCSLDRHDLLQLGAGFTLVERLREGHRRDVGEDLLEGHLLPHHLELVCQDKVGAAKPAPPGQHATSRRMVV